MSLCRYCFLDHPYGTACPPCFDDHDAPHGPVSAAGPPASSSAEPLPAFGVCDGTPATVNGGMA